MTPDARDILNRAADEALARLEARYHPDPALEAFYARQHALAHATPTVLPLTYAQQLDARDRHRRTVRQRANRAMRAARAAAQASMADPTNLALAARAADLEACAAAEEREAQQELNGK